jgi:hypothetical protein
MRQKRQCAEECGEEGREKRGLASSVLLKKRGGTKIKQQKSGMNENNESVPQQICAGVPKYTVAGKKRQLCGKQSTLWKN